MALTLRERCQKRLAGLKANRQPYEAEAKEIASLAQPARSRWLNSDTNKNVRQRNSRLNSSHGIFAFRTLEGGMTSGLSSPSRPWMTQTTFDEGLKEEPEVKEWLAEVERRMYAFLAQTNFYAAVKTGYLEMGLFGTEACYMEEVPTKFPGAVCHQLTFGEYWIGLGSMLTPEALYRRCPLTVVQAVQRFKDKVSPRVRSAYDRSDYDSVCDYYHAIEYNDEQEPGFASWRGRPCRSVYWDCEDGRKEDEYGGVLEIAGCHEQPFWAPRWNTVGGDVWGNGPGHDALPDLRELQLHVRRYGEAEDLSVWPEMIAPSRVKLRRQPRSVVSAAAADIEKVSVPHEIKEGTLDKIDARIVRCEESVNRAAFADLFMAITNMQGIQPRNIEEIAARNEEKLTQLGPTIERVNTEKLAVAVDRAFGIMERANLLPPPPEALMEAGGQTKTEFVSILTQMQRMVGLGQIERTAGFVGGLVATFPEAGDKLNVDEAIDEYASRGGAPPAMIRSNKQAEAIRAQRAQQQDMERIVAAAPAAKDGAMAAKVLSEIDAGSLPMAGAMPL